MVVKTVSLDIFYPPSEYREVLSLVVLGQPPRKSNSRRIVRNKKTGKQLIIKSDAALTYAKDFIKQVRNVVDPLMLGSKQEPLLLFAVVYYMSNRPDLSVELIKDLLQEAGVISDDRWVRAELLFFRIDKDNPRTELKLFKQVLGSPDNK